MFKILRKDNMNCLLFESVCLMGRSVLPEGSEMSVVDLSHIVNKYCIFFMNGKIESSSPKMDPIRKLERVGCSSFAIP